MVEVSVRVDDCDRQRCQAYNNGADLSHAEAGVEQKSTVIAEDEVGNDFLKLFWFVDRKHSGPDAVDLKP